jgi:hypothetical protein
VGVKHFSGRWLWAALLGMMLFVDGSLLLVGHSRVESSAGMGIVELAFSGTLTTSDGAAFSTEYQRALLNVVSVRITPSTDLSLSDSDPSWVTIPAPAAIGSTNPTQFITTSLNFGGSGTLLTAATSILQLDMVPLQNLPFFFNAASVPAQSYGQLELVLNSPNGGNVVPLCPQASPAGEGCITYSAALASQAVLRALFTTALVVPPGTVQPLVVNIAMTVGPPPTADPNTASVSISPVVSSQGNQSTALGAVIGTVVNFDSNTTVTAEYAGTNQIVAATKLQSDGTFVLNLPALTTPAFTLYDFYVSGNGAYVVRSNQKVSSQGNTSTPPPQTDLGVLAVPFSTFGTIIGTVADVCNGTAVEAATLKLLVPDTTTAGSATTCDLSGTPPALPSNCVVVATAATDDQGHYPLPSTPFTMVPVTPPPGVPYYDLEISAPGFNTTVPQVAAGSLFCPTSRFANSCSFSLEHGYLAGTTTLSSLNSTGQRLNALVMAEDSGTDKIENITLSTIPGHNSSGVFEMAVPDAAPSSDAIAVNNFDVFAAMQDLFQGSPQSNSGHLIGTAAGVGAPPSDCSTITIPALSPMDCVGLGSVDGSVLGANPSTTSVRLSKNGVQIMETEPNSIIASGNNYNFCAPSDSYLLTHYERNIAGSSVPIALAPPLTVSAPCSSICEDGNPGGTCLLCQPTAAPTLP